MEQQSGGAGPLWEERQSMIVTWEARDQQTNAIKNKKTIYTTNTEHSADQTHHTHFKRHPSVCLSLRVTRHTHHEHDTTRGTHSHTPNARHHTHTEQHTQSHKVSLPNSLWNVFHLYIHTRAHTQTMHTTHNIQVLVRVRVHVRVLVCPVSVF